MSTLTRASGQFRVDLQPLAADDEIIGRMRMVKTFTGSLTGESVGQMLSVGTLIEGSAAYVVIERVSGVLDGRRGTFVLQHSAVLRRGETRLEVGLVPDSGTDELLGISGTFRIYELGSHHHYEFDYAIDPSGN